MKLLKRISLLLSLILLMKCSYGQKPIVPDANTDNWTSMHAKVTYDSGIIHLERTGKETGLLWLKNKSFKNGTIELDIKGKDERGNSFVGFAFHADDDTYLDAVYFRPFNFKSPERYHHSVQYINEPNEPWNVLRKQFPEQYENPVSPVPNPNDWFHAKIVVQYPSIKVYVNNSKTPSLEVDQRSSRTNGKLGLWIGSKEGWFKNVVITKKD